MDDAVTCPSNPQIETATCQLCGKREPRDEMTPVALVRTALFEEIQKENPKISQDGFICKEDMNRHRLGYVQTLLSSEEGELTTLDREVAESLVQNEFLTRNLNEEFVRKLTLGEILSDRIADFGGSWTFIILFGAVLFLWVLLNSMVLIGRPFDPYPYILLNLILSCMAAIQAPVIMMSQNRQEAKDRMRSENDYRINLKAELEIRHLHEKVDHLLFRQWERNVEIQRIQIELMQEKLELKKNRPA